MKVANKYKYLKLICLKRLEHNKSKRKGNRKYKKLMGRRDRYKENKKQSRDRKGVRRE